MPSFWDYFPSKLDLLFEKVQRRLEEITGKEISCEKIFRYSDGLYCVSNGKKRRLITASKLKLNENELYELISLYNATGEVIRKIKEIAEALNVPESTVREWTFRKVSHVPYVIKFMNAVWKYYPKATPGKFFKYQIKNKEKKIVRLYEGLAIINEKGQLGTYPELKHMTYLGEARLVNLENLERYTKLYHTVLYPFAYKKQFYLIVTKFLTGKYAPW